MTADRVGCHDGCGRSVADVDAALAAAWLWLQIAKGWRCPACARQLAEVNRCLRDRADGPSPC